MSDFQKFLLALGIIVFLALGFFAGALVRGLFYEFYQKPRIEARTLQPYIKLWREDVYGGKTPEETWRLYLDALKKGDIELASKYFVVEERDRKLRGLLSVKEGGKLEELIKSREKLYRGQEQDISDTAVRYTKRKDDEGEIEVRWVFKLNPYTNIWKIAE